MMIERGGAPAGSRSSATSTIRRAGADDIAAIQAIEASSFSDPWAPASFASLLDDPMVYVSVSDVRGVVAGFAVLVVAADEADIMNIAVRTGARRCGIGSDLLDDVIREARVRGARTLYLDVREANVAARGMYASRGFAEAGRRRRYYTAPVEDALSLRLVLEE